MTLERLEYLSKFDKFYKMIVKQAKQNIINEAEFYMILAVKAKSMNKERIRRKVLLNKKAQ